jgi:D-tyrosyl-tRNA(Tyr) deacylase
LKALIQRVTKAQVRVEGEIKGEIEHGLLVFLGVGQGDTNVEALWLADKILGLRIFADDNGAMNVPITSVGGSILLVSQFTLMGDCRKGKRPSFSQAALPESAQALYQYFGRLLEKIVPVSFGEFGAHMEVSLINDGPVTFMLEKTPSEV